MAKDRRDKMDSRRKGIARIAKDYSAIEEDQRDRLGVKKNGKKQVYSHLQIATQMVKVIQVMPMHPLIRKVLTMRISGPLNGSPNSHMAIAISEGLTVDEVKEIEAEGVALAGEFIRRMSVIDGVKKFNKNSRNLRDLKNNMDNPAL